MAGEEGCDARRHRLATLIRQQAAASQCWERAEAIVRAGELRARLSDLGVPVTPDVAVALMAAALLLTSGSDDFGGDYRDALADVAGVGLELLGDQ